LQRRHRRQRHDAGVVDQYVDAAEALQRVFGEGLHAGAVGHVQFAGAGAAAGGGDRLGQPLQAVQAARAQHHARATRGEHARGGLADAAAGAGDQHHLAVDVVVHGGNSGWGCQSARKAEAAGTRRRTMPAWYSTPSVNSTSAAKPASSRESMWLARTRVAALVGAAAQAADLVVAAVGAQFVADVAVVAHPHPDVGWGTDGAVEADAGTRWEAGEGAGAMGILRRGWNHPRPAPVSTEFP